MCSSRKILCYSEKNWEIYQKGCVKYWIKFVETSYNGISLRFGVILKKIWGIYQKISVKYGT